MMDRSAIFTFDLVTILAKIPRHECEPLRRQLIRLTLSTIEFSYQRVTYRSNRGEMRRKPVLGSRDPSSIKLSVYEYVRDNLFIANSHMDIAFRTPYIFDSQNVEQDLAPGYQLCDIKDALLEKLINAADLRTECHVRGCKLFAYRH